MNSSMLFALENNDLISLETLILVQDDERSLEGFKKANEIKHLHFKSPYKGQPTNQLRNKN